MICTATIIFGMLAQLFTQPLAVPTTKLSLLWALPICLSISMVYKAIKLEEFRIGVYVREVLLALATIIGFLVVVKLALLAVAYLAWI